MISQDKSENSNHHTNFHEQYKNKECRTIILREA
jgi:hypothetical protein